MNSTKNTPIDFDTSSFDQEYKFIVNNLTNNGTPVVVRDSTYIEIPEGGYYHISYNTTY